MRPRCSIPKMNDLQSELRHDWWYPDEELGPWDWFPETWMQWLLSWRIPEPQVPDPPTDNVPPGDWLFHSFQSVQVGSSRRRIGWCPIPEPPLYGDFLLEGFPDAEMRWVPREVKPRPPFHLPGVWPNTVVYDATSNTLITMPYTGHILLGDDPPAKEAPYLQPYPAKEGIYPFDFTRSYSPFREGLAVMFSVSESLREWTDYDSPVGILAERFEDRVRFTGSLDEVVAFQYPDCVRFQTWRSARERLEDDGGEEREKLERKVLDVGYMRDAYRIILSRMFPDVAPYRLDPVCEELWVVEFGKLLVEGLEDFYQWRQGRRLRWSGGSGHNLQRGVALLIGDNEVGQAVLEIIAGGWDNKNYRGAFRSAATRNSFFDKATARLLQEKKPDFDQEDALRFRGRILGILRSGFEDNFWLSGSANPEDQWIAFLAVCYFVEAVSRAG